MISQIANKHADKCRFCWMCRHLCPVQLQTGKEINTPRAKGFSYPRLQEAQNLMRMWQRPCTNASFVMHVPMIVQQAMNHHCLSVKHVQKQS